MNRDELATVRTHLANERTLLAYIRTGLAFLAGGIGMIHLTSFHSYLTIGWSLICGGTAIIVLGARRFWICRRRIRSSPSPLVAEKEEKSL
ncbi:MAG TPA: DUF202 domain-containing protein [bacterium]|nr:DUF202 domain-containing protein [bacterium]HPN36423.1 DUF202 domain-containing protein [bacterium]